MSKARLICVFSLIITAVLLLPELLVRQVSAATLEVCPSLCTYSSVQDAVDAAADGDEILIDDGTYMENILVDGKNIALRSVNGPAVTILDGSAPSAGEAATVVSLSGGADTTLEGLTITGGAGTIDNPGLPEDSYGGGIYARDSGLSLVGCVVTANHASRQGGGVLAKFSTLSLDGTTISGNSAPEGSGVHVEDSDIEMCNCAVTGNEARDRTGTGGIPPRWQPESAFAFKGYRSIVTISSSEIADNVSGGINLLSGSFEMHESTVSGNRENLGVYVHAGDITVRWSLVSGNRGGIYVTGSGTIANSTVTGNKGEPGITVWYSSDVTISETVVSGNDGGGIRVGYSGLAAPIVLSNCLVTGNLSPSYGGGLFIFGHRNDGAGEDQRSIVTLVNSTVSGNRAYRGGGMALGRHAEVTAVNSILWGNEAHETQDDSRQIFPPPGYPPGTATEGLVLDVLYSTVEGGDPGTPGSPWPGDGNSDLDPGFLSPRPAVLAPTAGGDYRLAPCSGSIDSGTDDTATYPFLPATDFDGDARPWGGGYDMGAHEASHGTAGGPFPEAVDDVASVGEDGAATVDILFNDVLPNGALPVVSPVQPPHGSVQSNPDGTVTYTPHPNFNGLETFYYVIDDGTCTDVGQVTVEVLPAADPPFEVCDAGCPFDTIQGAIDHAGHGDRVLVHDGTYGENIDFTGKALTVASLNGPENTVIDGGGYGYNDPAYGSVVAFRSLEGPGSVLNGFTVMNGRADYGGGVRIVGRAESLVHPSAFTSPTISNCIVRDNTALNSGGGVYLYYGAPRIEGTAVRDNTADDYGGGLYLFPGRDNPDRPVVERSVVSGNSSFRGGGAMVRGPLLMENTMIYGNRGGLAVLGDNGSPISPEFRHCTISGNAPWGISVNYAIPRIVNSIIQDNLNIQIYLQAGSPADADVTYSNVALTLPALGPWPGTGNISENPSFVEPWPFVADVPTSRGDYHLRAESTSIDRAAPGYATVDIDGEARPQGLGSDMGADEYPSGPPPVEVDPVADVKANDSDGPVTVGAGEGLTVTASLAAGKDMGTPADWWAVVVTSFPSPYRYFSFDAASRSWQPGVRVTHQGPCADMTPARLLSQAKLPPGNYTFIFGVDMKMDGVPNRGEAVFDTVQVEVKSQ